MDSKRIVRAAATLIIAGSAGYFVQNGNAATSRVAVGNVSDTPTIATEAVVHSFEIPEIPTHDVAPEILHVERPPIGIQLALIDSQPDFSILNDAETPKPLILACDAELTGVAHDDAIIGISLSAPCHPNMRIVVSHAGLSFTETTDGSGKYSVQLPAFERKGQVDVTFDDGYSVQTNVTIHDLEDFHRAALLSSGQDELHLHALEYGAVFGEYGHIWIGAQNGSSTGEVSERGVMFSLGNALVFNAKLAEVYSLRTSHAMVDGVVEMVVEAAVSDDTCGREVTGSTIEMTTDGTLDKVALMLPIPDCDTVGGYLVLKNLLHDIMIATK